MSLLKIFSFNVKKFRQIRKLSQEKLAEISNLHRTYISDIECGRRNVSIENIEKIANALQIDAYLLLKDVKNND
ncbi:MAG TPA: helix-turn-helix transcriptional regulator [Candidatus Mucispirillum faecigallinarum]|uniref:Helix-turn-helix transcriptional regulator n=1 Tax=Candidatus Mucispirillum faecigallinarum TaxID=2838699 RepID=A0A9D2KB29_9BACT|nr:helix-turn-helix transcriptional regulator [Candidatus Mucispirillum faecigallinarum]